MLTPFVCKVERNVRGRTGRGTRVRLSARTTGAVHSRFQYDIPAPLLPYESPDSTGCVLLLLVSFASCGFFAAHTHALRLLYILVPYVCDVSRPASVCSYATLCYTHVCARLPVGLFPFQPAYIVISLSIVYVLFGICRRDSHIAGVCCTIAVLAIEELIVRVLTHLWETVGPST